jgi:hypothetical protein
MQIHMLSTNKIYLSSNLYAFTKHSVQYYKAVQEANWSGSDSIDPRIGAEQTPSDPRMGADQVLLISG